MKYQSKHCCQFLCRQILCIPYNWRKLFLLHNTFLFFMIISYGLMQHHLQNTEIHSNYNNWLEIIAFIEMNKILGISKFIVYNESMSENVSCVLEYYKESKNSVSIRTWDSLRKLQISTNMIKNRGVLASLNDCFYRHMNSYQYLFSIDLDEYIIPHMHETIPEMLQYLNSADIKYMDRHWRQKELMRKRPNRPNQNITTTYSFLNSFFYLVYGKIYAFM